MRISDWSSDVCSSDLLRCVLHGGWGRIRASAAAAAHGGGGPAHRRTWPGGLAGIVRFLVTMQPSRREVVTLTEQKGGQIMSGGARTGLTIAGVSGLVVIAVFAFGVVVMDPASVPDLPQQKN